MIQQMVRTLFPPEVHSICTTAEPDLGQLYPEEESCVRHAVAKRRREFAMGRLCARRALAHLGIRDFPLVAGKDRAPIWPETIVGSLSHCEGLCAVAVAPRSAVAAIGIDVELAEGLSSELFRLVLTDAEVAFARTLPEQEAGRWAKIVFSAKESIFKCIYPRTGIFLEFRDCTVELNERRNSFTASLAHRDVPCGLASRSLAGRFATDGARVLTGITLTVADETRRSRIRRPA